MIPLTLKTTHNKTAGFFSNCSIRLNQIVNSFNENKELPQSVDSSEQFRNYKENVNGPKKDLAKYFFEQKPASTNIEKINFTVSEQSKHFNKHI